MENKKDYTDAEKLIYYIKRRGNLYKAVGDNIDNPEYQESCYNKLEYAIKRVRQLRAAISRGEPSQDWDSEMAKQLANKSGRDERF